MATVVRGTVQGTDCPLCVSCRMLMNFQNQSIPSFCSTHLRVQAEGYTAQRNSVKDVAKNVARIVIQLDFLRILPLKLTALVSQFTTGYLLHCMCLETWGDTFNCDCF